MASVSVCVQVISGLSVTLNGAVEWHVLNMVE